MPNLTQFEMDMITRAVNALEAIAEELKTFRELKVAEKAKEESEEKVLETLN